MKFKDAVAATPGLENAWQSGLNALRNEDKVHIAPENTRSLSGSVDIDQACKKTHPEDNRWDFAIGYKHSNRSEEFIYWVELHSGHTSQIKTVLNKAQWLLKWLRDNKNKLSRFKRDIVWVSSGKTSLSPLAPQRKRLAQVGVRQVGRTLRIPDKRID